MTVGQDHFTEALLTPDAAIPEGLTDPEGRPAGRRFNVYRNNVAVSLTEALETAFPVIRKLVGEANFRTLAGTYLRQHPPRSPLMMFYGEDMPAFLEGFPPVASLGYLPDVARLELAIRRAYHAADAAPLDPARLQALSPEELMAARFRLAPATRVIRSPWPIHAIWRFNMEPGAPKPSAVAEDVLVHRAEFDPDLSVLGPGAASFVLALAGGQTLGEAVEAAGTPEFDLASALGLLLGTGTLTDLET